MEVTMAVVCEYANRSEDGKLNILGTFNEIHPAGFPFVWPQLYVVVEYEASVAEVGEQKRIRCALHAEDGPEVLSLQVEYTVDPPSHPGRPRYLSSIFGLSQIQFDGAGDYAFHILIGGEEKKRVPLYVQPPPQLETGGPDV